MKYIKLFTFLFISLVFVQCTMQKRVYNKGYHVNWHKKLVDSKATDKTVKVQQKVEPNITVEVLKLEEVVLASSDLNFIPDLVKKQKVKNALPNDSCGDVITMKNGDEITVKVVEINERAIKYRACNNLSGPLIVIPKEKVFMIHYANGSKEVISSTPAKETPKEKEAAKNNLEKEWKWCAVASLICFALFFLFFTAIASAILAVIAHNQIEKNPDKYKGKWMMYPGLVIAGIMAVTLLILIIALIIALAVI